MHTTSVHEPWSATRGDLHDSWIYIYSKPKSKGIKQRGGSKASTGDSPAISCSTNLAASSSYHSSEGNLYFNQAPFLLPINHFAMARRSSCYTIWSLASPFRLPELILAAEYLSPVRHAPRNLVHYYPCRFLSTWAAYQVNYSEHWLDWFTRIIFCCGVSFLRRISN